VGRRARDHRRRQALLAITTDGQAWCWGYGSGGRLGLGSTTNKSTPTKIPNLTGVAQIAIGWDQTCARKTDNTVWCWGPGYSGQLGDGQYQQYDSPTMVPGLTATDLGSGGTHVCALKLDGTVACWGGDWDGQLGDGLTASTDPVGTQMTCP
jgi:alpha-tubulin suppressor-like RCC1 family protein